jgi:hypothetical protein
MDESQWANHNDKRLELQGKITQAGWKKDT